MKGLKCWTFVLLQLILLDTVLGQNLSYHELEQSILEKLLQSPYDNRIRPMASSGNNGTVVAVNMFIRSFDYIDDVNMQYSIQLTFRQQWNDNRLRFSHLNPPEKLKYLTLSRSSSPVWSPDLFFSNEKSGNFHGMLVPNTFIRIFPDGDVLYSARLSMTLSCPMQLRRFPFDEQTCFIRMASYGYTTDDLIFRWKSEEPLQLTPHLNLPRFSLDRFTTEYCDSVTNTGTYSCLVMKFRLIREYSYYNAQIFMPCAMLVLIGWLTFWINRYEAAGRLVVLIATLLVMATLIGGFNVTVPKVSYTKASDVWTVSCFMFIFVALFQFIVVHYVTSCEDGAVRERTRESPTVENLSLIGGGDGAGETVARKDGDNGSKGRNRRDDVEEGCAQMYKYCTWEWFKEQPMGQQIDIVSRLVYPVAFIIFNISYWPKYYN